MFLAGIVKSKYTHSQARRSPEQGGDPTQAEANWLSRILARHDTDTETRCNRTESNLCGLGMNQVPSTP